MDRYVPQNVIKQNWRIKMSELKAKTLHMGPAQCAVDLGDGSERGEYVNQDYILPVSYTHLTLPTKRIV